jgi:hypothetical protein
MIGMNIAEPAFRCIQSKFSRLYAVWMKNILPIKKLKLWSCIQMNFYPNPEESTMKYVASEF